MRIQARGATLALVASLSIGAVAVSAGARLDREPAQRPPQRGSDETPRDPKATDLGPTDTEARKGDACATGCSAASYARDVLGDAELARLLGVWADGPESPAGTHALDTLLFHADEASAYAERYGLWPLGARAADWLTAELARDTAWLSVRLVDSRGEERLQLPPTRVPLGEKQHLIAERVRDLQPPEVSGTVRRVGEKHLWVRL